MRLSEFPAQSNWGRSVINNPSVYATGQSDRPIVPRKPSNKDSLAGKPGHRPAEMVEGRELTKGNSFESVTRRTQRRRERYGEP